MAKKPRHGSRRQVKSSLVPPSLRNGGKRKSLETTRKSQLEALEERRLLSVNPTGASATTSISSSWQPEADFEVGAAHPASSPILDSGGNPVWDLGIYNSGNNSGSFQETGSGTGTQDYTYTRAVKPTTFFTDGDGNAQAFDGTTGGKFPGAAGWQSYTNASLGFSYGPGLGSGGQVVAPNHNDTADFPVASSWTGGLIAIPTGTVFMSSLGGPSAIRFKAQTTGSISISATFTNPMFDPFPVGPENNGGEGGRQSDDPWSWDDGQPDWGVFETTGETTDNGPATVGGTDGGTYHLLASAFPQDIAAVGTIPTVGSPSTNGSGLTINTAGASFGNVHEGNNGHYGSGGTWQLSNAGPIYNTYDYEHQGETGNRSPWIGTRTAGHTGPDSTNDEYDMTWTYTGTLHVTAGQTIDFTSDPEFNSLTNTSVGGGDYQGITYLAATIKTVTAAPSVAPPSLTQVGPTNTFTVGGSAVAVDSGMDVSSSDADITGAVMTITNEQSGDSLSFTNQSGITGSYNAGTGTLTLTGSATPAQYQTALRTVAFSTTSPNTLARSISVTGDDTGASPTTGNTISETVDISLPAPVVTESGPSVTKTAGGPAVTVDSGVTVTSHDTSINGATVTITNAQTGDSLVFNNQNGITGSYNSGTGTLTLTGSSSVANYQTALRTVTYANTTNTSLTTRDISMAASDSNATPHTGATSSGDLIHVVAPLEVTGVYTSGSAWVTGFKSYLGSHSEGSASFGFNVADGSTQLSDLTWFNLNTITIVFNGAPSQINQSSLEVLSGGSNTVHTITGFSSLGGNAYSWTLGSSLTNAKYVLALASTTSSFGTPVEDAQGAGLDGKFVNSASVAGAAISPSAPSGTGLAGSGALDVFFNVLPGDLNRDGQDNGTDVSIMRPLSSNTRDNSTLYSPFDDVNGDGSINTTDLSLIRPDSGRLATGNPTAPADTQVGGLALDSASLDSGTALGVIESSSSAPASSSSANNTGGSVASAPASSSSSSSTGSAGDDDDDSTSLASADDATDEAVSSFDLSDLYV